MGIGEEDMLGVEKKLEGSLEWRVRRAEGVEGRWVDRTGRRREEYRSPDIRVGDCVLLVRERRLKECVFVVSS